MRISTYLRLLDLSSVHDSYRLLIDQAIKGRLTYEDFIENILEKAISIKEENRILRWIQIAKFPFVKTLENFNFEAQPKIDEKLIKSLVSCRFVGKGENIVFLGPPGVGKTHLSISIGIEAINLGYEVRFIGLDKLIDEVDKYNHDVTGSSRFFRSLVRPNLLIIDELDYYHTGKNSGTFLFKLIFERYNNNASIILTSSKEFSEWESVFGDNKRAAAAIDRVLEKAHIISINGESYRIKERASLNL